MKKKKVLWIVSLIVSILFFAFGIVTLIPPLKIQGYVKDAVKIVAGIILLIYALLFLLPNVDKNCSEDRKKYRVIIILRYLEIVLAIFIAISLFVEIKNVNFTLSKCLAIPVYAFGVVEIIRGYTSDGDIKITTSKGKIITNRLAKYLNIFLITAGTYVYIKEPLKVMHVVYAIAVIAILAGLIGIYFAVKIKKQLPKKVKEPKEKKEKVAKEPKEKKEKVVKESKEKTAKVEEVTEIPVVIEEKDATEKIEVTDEVVTEVNETKDDEAKKVNTEVVDEIVDEDTIDEVKNEEVIEEVQEEIAEEIKEEANEEIVIEEVKEDTK